MAKYTKPESEQIVRRLCHDWLTEQLEAKREHPSFTDFRTRPEAHYPGVFSFRSRVSPLHDAGMWFDDELGHRGRGQPMGAVTTISHVIAREVRQWRDHSQLGAG